MTTRVVVALVDDLMDRSRLSAAIEGVRFVRDAAEASGADVVIVDLARHAGAVARVREATPAAHIVAFGPHIDDHTLARAEADGADLVLPRSRFFRDPGGALISGRPRSAPGYPAPPSGSLDRSDSPD